MALDIVNCGLRFFPLAFAILFLLTYASAATPSCPEKCICESFVHGYRVKCQNQQLVSIPVGIPNITTVLNLDMNMITRVPQRAFADQLPLLVSLSMEQNQMFEFDPMALALSTVSSETGGYISAVPNLMLLSLADNAFTAIPSISCELAPNLTSLAFEKNMISSFDFPSNYSKCNMLQWISASENLAGSLGPNNFLNLNLSGNLRLSLGDNIKKIDPESFKPIKMKADAIMLGNNPIDYEGLKNVSLALNSSTSLTSLSLKNLYRFENESIIPPLNELFLPNLTNLEVSSNPLWNFTIKFNGMPKLHSFFAISCLRCEFSDSFFLSFPSLQILHLGNSELKRIPANLPSSIENLNLFGSRLGNLSANNFSLMPSLMQLDMGESQITELNPQNFQLKKLLFFNLSSNSIDETSLYINQSIFKDMNELKFLDLSYNNIMGLIEPDLFPLPNLQILKLNNQKTTIFEGLEELHPEIFSQLNSLLTLDLSFNSYLGKAFMADENGRLFANLSNLHLLNLASTKLSTVPALLFKGVSTLVSLELHKNEITCDSLKNITSNLNISRISLINLKNNSISQISKTTLDLWSSSRNLALIDLSENPFQCDSGLVDFHRWLRNATNDFTANDTNPNAANQPIIPGRLTVVGYRSYKCQPSGQCSNRLLIDLEEGLELCIEAQELPVSAIVLIVVGSLLLIIIIVVIIGFTVITVRKKQAAQRSLIETNVQEQDPKTIERFSPYA